MTNYHQPCSLGSWLGLFVVCLGALMSAGVFAASGGSDRPLVEFQSQQGIGPERAAAIVQANVEGKVLSVSSGTHNGKPVYRVKVLLSGGRVKVMQVSAADGQLLD